jgi:hypothetical protein
MAIKFVGHRNHMEPNECFTTTVEGDDVLPQEYNIEKLQLQLQILQVQEVTGDVIPET